MNTPAPSSCMWARIWRAHVVGIPDERQPLLLRQVEVELVEGQLLRGPDERRPRRRRLAEQLHRAAVIAQELLPEVVEMRLRFLPRPRVRLGPVDVAQHETVLRRRRPSVARREPAAQEGRRREAEREHNACEREELGERPAAPEPAAQRLETGRLVFGQRRILRPCVNSAACPGFCEAALRVKQVSSSSVLSVLLCCSSSFLILRSIGVGHGAESGSPRRWGIGTQRSKSSRGRGQGQVGGYPYPCLLRLRRSATL